MREQIRAHRHEYRRIFVAYAECGTMGRLDALLAEDGIERVSGPHCYSLYAGEQTIAELTDAGSRREPMRGRQTKLT